MVAGNSLWQQLELVVRGHELGLEVAPILVPGPLASDAVVIRELDLSSAPRAIKVVGSDGQIVRRPQRQHMDVVLNP